MAEREGVLAGAPLIFAFSVVRFSPILKLPQLIPDIHQAIRDRLPGFFQMVKSMQPGIAQGSEPNSWAFLDRNAEYACVLGVDHLILQSTNYLHFASHLELFRECLTALTQHSGGLDIAGIGMRYVDRIEPLDGETLADYLPDTLLPLNCEALAKREVKALMGVSTTTYQLDSEFLHIRCWRQTGMWIPDDLAEPAMVFEIAKQTRQPSKPFGQSQSVFVPVSENGALLDTDAYWPMPMTERLVTEEICGRLDKLHGTANFAFRAVAKDHAFEVWGKSR